MHIVWLGGSREGCRPSGWRQPVTPRMLHPHAAQEVLDCIDAPVDVAASRPERAVFCNRTLNLRGIKAIGYDLDYTLLHYSVDAWEGRAYAYGLEALRDMGLPVDGLAFDSSLVIRGWALCASRARGKLPQHHCRSQLPAASWGIAC